MTKEPPPKWGQDKLSELFQAAHENIFATFVNKKTQFMGFCSIDNVLTKVIEHLVNPNAHLESLLFCRAQSHFRAAVMLCSSGQIPEAYQIIRVMLEQAGYAFFIHNEFNPIGESISAELLNEDGKPTRSAVWLNRGKGSVEDKAFLNLFKIGKVRDEISKEDPETAFVFDVLYKLSIDLGGHPNPQGVLTNIKITELDGTKEYKTNYLQGDGVQLNLCLKSCAEGGLVVLSLFEKVFPERFSILSMDSILKSMKENIFKIFGNSQRT